MCFDPYVKNSTMCMLLFAVDGSINLPEVRNMLGQSDTQMSDSAKALFNAMEAFQKVHTRF